MTTHRQLPPRHRFRRRVRSPRPVEVRPRPRDADAVLRPSRGSLPTGTDTTSPLQYRLQVLDGLTGPELDAFIASGFVEHGGFELAADGTWRQTGLEGDVPTPQTAAED